jgi:hypothetical protein
MAEFTKQQVLYSSRQQSKEFNLSKVQKQETTSNAGKPREHILNKHDPITAEIYMPFSTELSTATPSTRYGPRARTR